MAFTTTITNIEFSDAQISRDAAQILESAREFVKSILKQRTALDSAGKKDEPVYVVLGEKHIVPSHRLHHMMVIELLRQAGETLTVSDERAHDQLGKDFFREIIDSYDRDVASEILRRDEAEAFSLSLSQEFAFHTHNYANHVNKLLLLYLQSQNIPLVFTDCAKTEDLKPDQDDVTTQDSINAIVTDDQDRDDIPYEAEMDIRNHHMATKLQNVSASLRNPRIVVQICGSNHVVGNGTTGYSYAHSIVGFLKAQDRSVISHKPLQMGFGWTRPKDAPVDFQNHVEDSYLPDDEAQYRLPSFGCEPVPLSGTLQHPEDEAAYCQAIMVEMGLSAHFHDHATVTEKRAETRCDVTEVFRRLNDEFFPFYGQDGCVDVNDNQQPDQQPLVPIAAPAQ